MLQKIKDRTKRTKNGYAAAALLLLAFFLPACSTNQPAGRQVDDTWIATKIESKLLADTEINNFKVDVDVEEGVVRLSGTVEKMTTKQSAERLAHDTNGVVRVINDIEVGDGSLGDRVDNTAIAAKVKAKITGDSELNPFNINVDSEDGHVTLMGRVKNEANKQEAERLARTVDGVTSVKNLLEVGDYRADS